jgi:predicted RNA-binding Zn-ribbon protein involved in translation (DUF1610 family)
MIKITCTSCQKPLSLDETKLPMKEVSFPCPVCKTKITVDRRKLGGEAAVAPVVPPESGTSGGDQDSEENEDEFGTKAFIVGGDNPNLRQAAKLVGYLPIYFASAEQARDRYLQEVPAVVIMNPPQMTAPPLEAMQPLTGLSTAERRKSFFILVSDNLRTLDGNAAFLYGVNLIVASKDLNNFPRIFKEAHQFHERLYTSMNSALRALDAP